MQAVFRQGLLAALVCAGVPLTVGAQDVPVAIHFSLEANEQPVRCGVALGPLGADGVAAGLRDARFYVQDVVLVDAGGTPVPVRLAENDWQNAQVAMLDFEDGTGRCTGGTAEINTTVTGAVPAGDYVGLRFTVGVPQAMNHTSTELEGPPLDLAAMGWSWQAGRKYLKIEVDPDGGIARDDGSRAASWLIHLGATGCTGNPMLGKVACLRENRVPVAFDRFDPAGQQVVLDLAALFAASRLSEDHGGAAGCMSSPDDPECDEVFGRLGLSFASGLPATPGVSPVFRVGKRP